MKRIILHIALKLLRIPPIKGNIDRDKEFFGNMYPIKAFRDYISQRDLELLQLLGGSVSREDYLIYLGQRVELGLLLQKAKKDFDIIEKGRLKSK